MNGFLLRAIIGKLTGRALVLVGSRTELRTWEQIKSTLQLCFEDQRNLIRLVNDLIVLKAQKNEAPYTFGTRCQDARSLIMSKLRIMNISDEERTLRSQNYEGNYLRQGP